ncbi:hypothetical protein B9Z55_012498 [Caenorhabditis nigoni]|uniref:Uncharacterized protein n=1 Tax=Caenorhabditis nigoni TaxID=1611254 RepID=A0A2G5TY18_9PELO|nr:hypothetical protein B9Z55_012498 [Caenorhabditis nigoni]
MRIYKIQVKDYIHFQAVQRPLDPFKIWALCQEVDGVLKRMKKLFYTPDEKCNLHHAANVLDEINDVKVDNVWTINEMTHSEVVINRKYMIFQRH